MASALERAAEKIANRAVPKADVEAFGADIDIMALIEKIGDVIVRVIESCAQNFPYMQSHERVERIAANMRDTNFITRIRFRRTVAESLGTSFWSRYTEEVCRECMMAPKEDEGLAKEVIAEVLAPAPLRPNFLF